MTRPQRCGTHQCIRRHFAGEADAKVAVAIAMDSQTVTAWMNEIASSVRAERDYLVQLDAAIGDGDHGINMNRGFDAVTLALSTEPDGTPGKLLILAGKTLISTVGGGGGARFRPGPRRRRARRQDHGRRARPGGDGHARGSGSRRVKRRDAALGR